MQYRMLFAALLIATVVHADERFGPPPQKWLAKGGTGFELCDNGVDAQMLKAGQRNLTISCEAATMSLLRQSFNASPYWGKRLRFAGWVKTRAVESLEAPGALPAGGGLFFSANGGPGATVGSMVTGTTDWTYRELVIDIPRQTDWILIGISLSGRGQVWGRDFKFEEVASDVPVTPATALH